MIIDRLLSVPFVSQGRAYDGADCWGLVWLYYRDVFGITLEAYAETPATSARTVARLMAQHREEWTRVDEPQTGDVVIMRCRSGARLERHVGIYVPRRSVLHTEDGVGARRERIDLPHMAGRIVEYRRHNP